MYIQGETVMPVVADLASQTIIGFGAAPMSHLANDTPLSSGHATKYKYCPVDITVSATNRLTCTQATGIAIKGSYLFFEDNWATVCRMDIIRPIVVSGGFSGCAFKVYRGGGAFFAAHIARPSGASADANVALLDDYAGQKGWQEIQHVPTSGVVGANPAATAVAIVSQLIGNSIDTVRLALNNMGQTVNVHRVTTPF
jgi:hypothetical protein